jgi:hypothetical protein
MRQDWRFCNEIGNVAVAGVYVIFPAKPTGAIARTQNIKHCTAHTVYLTASGVRK